jgi:hypothetical protein
MSETVYWVVSVVRVELLIANNFDHAFLWLNGKIGHLVVKNGTT